ncbi:MAG: hypothetical protein ACRDCE_04630 [Cetobacterium sp.]|uniref:hypothetical protein n=1 Tax=Cetobacterium sp. TaxID=2071632 RepID=UPI003EE7F4BB
MLKQMVKRLEILLKLNIIEGYDNVANIRVLYADTIKAGYPETLLKAKLQILKSNFLAEKELNDILGCVDTLTYEDIKILEWEKEQERCAIN